MALRLLALDIESYVVDYGGTIISNNIRSITQDDQGYIWMGSSYGLLRYDGFSTHTYTHTTTDNDSLLYDNHIRDVIYWTDGLVVVRVQGFLCTLFDTHIGRFIQFPLSKTECLRYTRMTMGLHHDLWLYNDKHEGVCLTVTRTKDKERKFSLCRKGLGKVPRDIRGHHWDNMGNTINVADDGQIVYTDRETGRRFTFPIFDGRRDGKTMKVDYKVQTVGNLIWVSTYGYGITVYDKSTDALMHIRAGDGSALKTNFIVSIFADRQGNVWALQELHGVVCFSMERKRQTVISLGGKGGNEHDEYVKAVVPMPNGSSLVSVNSGRLMEVDADHRVSQVSELGGDAVLTMYTLSNGHTILGSRHHGIMLDGKWYGHNPHDPGSLSGNKVSGIVCDKRGRLWIALQDGRVDAAIRKGNRWLFYHVLPPDIYTSIIIDHMGNIWVTGVGRIGYFNPDKILLDPTSYHIYNMYGVRDITQIMEDSHHRLWVASHGKGAFWTYNGDKEKTGVNGGKALLFHAVDHTKGLANDMVASIIEDRYGHIYIATQKGMCIYNPSTGRVQTQLTDRSVGHNYFTDRASCRLSDGRLAFGTIEGLVIFTPQKTMQQTKPLSSSEKKISRLRVTDVLVNGSSIIGSADDKMVRRLNEKNELSVAHDENTLTFRFSDFNFNTLGKSVFSYKLEGYDRQWSAMGNSSSGLNNAMAVYKNLPHGCYLFRVRAYTPDMQSYEEYALRVIVLPPWWLTWWAIGGYCVLLAVIAIIVFRQLRTTYRLRQRVALEKQMTEFKLRFFTDISHEFRTPLTIIHGAIDHIRMSKNLPGDIKQPLSNLASSEERMMRLVNQLLEFRKMENGKLRLALQETDVVAFVRNIFNSFMDSAEAKHIAYTFLPQAKETVLYVDRGHVDKITYNLISNAIKYTPSGGSVMVGVRREFSEGKETINVIVSDTGVGIDKERQDKLFQRFTQSAYTGDSMGIGLNLSLELARVHKGGITYKGNAPQGSVFTLTLPYVTDRSQPKPYVDADFLVAGSPIISTVKDEVKDAETEYHEMKAKPLNDRTVLVVEDDHDVMNYLCSLLGKYFNVLACSDGSEALKALEDKGNIDLMVTDIMMPGMNGYQLTQRIKANKSWRTIPIIMLSALSDPADQSKGIGLGVDAFITKPFDNEVLLSTCLNLIEKTDQQRQEVTQAAILATTDGDDKTAGKIERNLKYIAPPPVIKDERDKQWIEILDMWMESHIGDQSVTVDTMAQAMKMSRTSFFSKVKTLTGMTPNDLLRRRRLERAAALLAEGKMNVSEVADETGFASAHYFSNTFKQFYGITPKRYQQGEMSAEEPD